MTSGELGATMPDPPYILEDVRLDGAGVEPISVLVDGAGRLQGPSRRAPHAKVPIVRGEGARLAPGFIDPHVHIRAAASASAAVDISRLTGPRQILDEVRRAPRAGGWVSLWGLQPEVLEGPPPTADELDAASNGDPVRIRHRSAHAWILSRSALRELDIDPNAGIPGLHVETSSDGSASGGIVDHGGWLRDRMKRVTPSERLRTEVRGWSRALAMRGVVGVIDATVTNGPDELREMAQWKTEGLILQHVGAMTSATARPGPPPLHFAGHKFMPALTPDLGAAIRRSWSQGAPVAIHCVDTEELAAVIEAVEGVPDQRRGRLRIEHLSVCPHVWLERVARLGPTVVTHPAFVYAHGDRYLSNPDLAPHDWLYRVASLQQVGVRVAFASDAPSGPTDPLLQLRAARDRRTSSGLALGLGEAVSVEDALAAMTKQAASLAGSPQAGVGRLSFGAPVNAVVVRLGADGWTDPQTEVLATMIDGHPVR